MRRFIPFVFVFCVVTSGSSPLAASPPFQNPDTYANRLSALEQRVHTVKSEAEQKKSLIEQRLEYAKSHNHLSQSCCRFFEQESQDQMNSCSKVFQGADSLLVNIRLAEHDVFALRNEMWSCQQQDSIPPGGARDSNFDRSLLRIFALEEKIKGQIQTIESAVEEKTRLLDAVQ